MTKRKSRAASIAALNDAFRRKLPSGAGRVFCTAGVNANGAKFVSKALATVVAFDAFTKSNDPHHEHDFGSIEVEEQRLFWKIDYYDLSMQFGSEDPTDATKTLRVLTIMLAEEY